MKRVEFPDGKQKDFIANSLRGNSLKQFLSSSKLKISYSTFKHYARGDITLPLDAAEKIAKISNQNLSNYNIKLLEDNWGAIKGGKKGIVSMYSKHKDKLPTWRRKGFNSGLINFSKPKKIKRIAFDERLAEFIGVYLGDGTLTKYFVRIFGDKRHDLHYFNYLASLVELISNIEPKIRTEKGKNLLILDIKSKLFCDYLKNELGFNYGDKIRNKSIIPLAIINNKKLILHCLRGLIDTDGTVCKDGRALCIRFRSHNPLLIEQLSELNNKLKLFTFSYKRVIGTKKKDKIDEFFKKVGSSNLSNIIRYCEFKKGNLLRKTETLKYADLYNNVKIPYGPVV